MINNSLLPFAFIMYVLLSRNTTTHILFFFTYPRFVVIHKAFPFKGRNMSVAPGNVASPGNVIIYGKCRTVAGKCRNLLKTS